MEVPEFFVPLSYDEEVAKMQSMNTQQLLFLKKRIIKIKKDDTKQGKVQNTDEEEYAYRSMIDWLDKYYPVKDVTDYVKEKNQEPRKKIVDDNRLIVIRNHKIYTKDDRYEVWLKSIDELIGKKAYNHKDYMNERIVCECGASSVRKNLSTHKKSALHIKRLCVAINEDE